MRKNTTLWVQSLREQYSEHCMHGAYPCRHGFSLIRRLISTFWPCTTYKTCSRICEHSDASVATQGDRERVCVCLCLLQHSSHESFEFTGWTVHRNSFTPQCSVSCCAQEVLKFHFKASRGTNRAYVLTGVPEIAVLLCSCGLTCHTVMF